MDTCLSKFMASNLSWPSVKHRRASAVSFFFSSPNLLLLPIFIPLRRDLPNSLPTSCGSFCHKVHFCVPAQVCSMSIHLFLFTGKRPLLFKAKSLSSLWSCWYCWLLPPWILYSLRTCGLIFLLLSWLLLWKLPLLTFKCHIPHYVHSLPLTLIQAAWSTSCSS